MFHGSLFDILPQLAPKSVHAVITSPPYAEQRKKQYGGVAEADYPAWTIDWMRQIRRVLTDDGNVAIIIRPHVHHGVISDYVLLTRLGLRADGWNEIEELIWIKPGAPPLGNIARPRRSWESILWFANSTTPFCDPLANGQMSERIGLDSKKGMADYLHDQQARAVTCGISRCRDYVEVSTHECHKESYNTHPAQFPEKLARWLIRLLSPSGGTILDPFSGSGTTMVAAMQENRQFVGSEINAEYVKVAERRARERTFCGSDYFMFGS
jgi:site-specific DNA-methyltransferase (adenine-specific)/site-specific DNA-methyltransferase (cytosine-N4-specific)